MRDISALITEYKARFPQGEYREREPMSAHTSFRIGGAVRVMFLPSSAEETAFLVSLIRSAGMPLLVMGNGSDLLVSDAPLDMAVIKIGERMADIRITGTAVTAGAGALFARVSAAARDAGLSGLEFACGIPGSLGGAVYMNAGAYGGEIKDVLRSVTVLDKDLNVVKRSAEECDLSYRHSRFTDGSEIILSAELELCPGDRGAIGARMEELLRCRREKQPVELPSAGSTFKRPAGGYAAALIDEAGLKGCSVGGAQVSAKHAGFVVNTGGATFDDVIALMKLVRDTVYARTGIELEPEVRIIR